MNVIRERSAAWLIGIGMLGAAASLLTLPAPADELPSYLRDRGPGNPTSMSGTYVRKGELLVYPFFEYYYDNNTEYTPSSLGHVGDQTFHAKYRASEGILFWGYGINERVAVEMEAAVIKARQEKDPADPSAVPPVIEESGTGDVEGQLHVKLLDETDHHPALYTYFEAVSPQEKDKLLIGTPDWEFALGAHAIRGYMWGTLTLRAAASYKLEDKTLDMGEYAIEYLRSLSGRWKVYAGVEGEQSDLALIAEAQWHFSRSAYLKLNDSVGLTPNATDNAPEVGVMFSFGGK